MASRPTGLIAGEEGNVEGTSQHMLITHRNLNVIANVVATSMTLWRVNYRTPNAAYLRVVAAGVGVLAYTAFLGGKFAYEVGVGQRGLQ